MDGVEDGFFVGATVIDGVATGMCEEIFGRLENSLFGDKHVHGAEGISFYTRAKVVTARWPHVAHSAPALCLCSSEARASAISPSPRSRYPNSDQTHEQFVLAALAAAKPVLCEKPLAPDLAGCARILDAEVEVGRRLVSVGFMRRYDPGYVALKDALVSDQIGRALMVHCTHRNASVVAGLESSKLISGSAVHEIDIARWLLDEELAAVTVHKPRRSAGAVGTQDPLFLVYESVSGVLVDVEVFVNAGYGYGVRCELVADRGTVLLDSPPPTVLRDTGSIARAVPADWRLRFAEASRPAV